MSSEPLDLDLTDDDEPVEERETRFEGYADYRRISLRVASSIDRAVDAYARLDSAHNENAQVPPELAAEARGRIYGAAIKLIPELEDDREHVDDYDDILERWEDGEDEDERGFIARLNDTQLKSDSPAWLFQMVLDIRTAGWKLGYLRAGRETETSDGDPVEQESDAMVSDA